MSFLDIFRKSSPTSVEQTKDENPLPEINESDFVDYSDPSKSNQETYYINIGSNLPIDVIYTFLKEDYESKAYQDALNNPDRSYMNANIDLLKSTLSIKFKQILLKYDTMLDVLHYHIDTRKQAGLTDVVDLLETKKKIYTKHVDTIQKMKEDLASNEPYMTRIFTSYEIGFKRGLSALTILNLKIEDSI